ncbi:MAG: LysM peptidoglycan-binding domain-containing protein [Myxococcales bacterium]|nr:LysM peptidoglycan-binding domain-containing protein [Myxococcales bacterium]
MRYRVRSGDSLWRISQRFHVSIADLCKWNGLRRSSTLGIGDSLRIYLGGRAASAHAAAQARSTASKPTQSLSSDSPPRTFARTLAPTGSRRHVVKDGESPWLIAQAHGVDVTQLLAANRLRAKDVIQPGQVLVVPDPRRSTASKVPSSAASHRVQLGESYWSISQSYGLSVAELLDLNGRRAEDVLRPGEILRVSRNAPTTP